ncbi:TetR/AcrR family transcriptional regulator [Nonomuraea sp. NPDC003201]
MRIKPVRPERRGRRRLGTENPEVQRRLLHAAGEIIAADGWPALRIDDLVRRAGLSVGTFYLYFDNKADLFVQLVIQHTERLRARLREAHASEGPAAERLDRALDAYLDFVTETGPGFLHFRNAGNIETTVGPLSTWAFAQHADDLRPLLETAMGEGAIREEDPSLLAQAVLALNQHIAAFWLEHPDQYSRQRIKQFLSDFVTYGLNSDR